VQLIVAGLVDPLADAHRPSPAQIEITAQLTFQAALHEAEVLDELIRGVRLRVGGDVAVERVERLADRSVDTAAGGGDGVDVIL